MKQKMFLIVAALVLLSTADSFAQLTKIWDRSNQDETFQWLCPKGKLAVVSRSNQDRLIDLTNGQTIYSVDNPEYIYLDNSGNRFFVVNYQTDKCKVYDRQTLKSVQDLSFRRYIDGYISPNDSTNVEFDLATNSLKFWNIYTNVLVDNYKIPNTPDKPEYSIYPNSEFSSDGRYFAFHIYKTHDATNMYFLLYDRQTREIIMQKNLPKDNFLNYRYFNIKNHMAYAENIKLPEDDKPYSYIRIYDLDKREVVKNIRVNEYITKIRRIVPRNDDQFILFTASPGNNVYFYDNLKEEISNFKFSEFPGPLYFDDSLYVAFGSFVGYKFNWKVVGVEEEPIPNIPIIYPNPTTNTINLNIEPSYYNGHWQLTDLTGQILLKGEISNNENFQLDISNLTPATYFLRISNGKEIRVEKVVKW
jgi:WD40 repeat protein